jgi:hypothetical protein
MTTLEISNTKYLRIKDTIYDSSLMIGLAKLGILPLSFRVVKAHVDMSGVLSGEQIAIIDELTGEQVKLQEGQQVVQLSAVALEDLVGAGSVQIGLAASATGSIDTALSAVSSVASVNADGLGLDDAGILVNDTDKCLVAEAVSADITSGILQVVLVIV